jgi:predicted PurR-regulated permease PerM
MNTFLQKILLVFITCAILMVAKGFLIPLAYSFLIAMVLYPVTSFLERKKFGVFLSIILPLLLVCVVFSGLLTLLAYEAVILSGNWPLVQEKLNIIFNNLQLELEKEFGWTTAAQLDWAKESLQKTTQNLGSFIQQTFRVTFEALFNLIIIPIYVSLILIYRRKIIALVRDLAPVQYRDKVPVVIKETVIMYGRFIRGMVMVYISVGILNAVGLFLLGVEKAIIFGMITAFMTIIPYFGIIISALLPISISWINTGNVWQPLGVIGVFSLVQYLEANLIFPYIVGKQVNINTLAAIMAIFIGSLIWGVAGMILFLPFVAMFRIFAGHFEELKPWATFLETKH